MWRLNNMLPKNQWVNDEIRKYLEIKKMKTQLYKIYWMWQKQFLEGSSSQHRPSSRNMKNFEQPNLPPKGTRERRTHKTQS